LVGTNIRFTAFSPSTKAYHEGHPSGGYCKPPLFRRRLCDAPSSKLLEGVSHQHREPDLSRQLTAFILFFEREIVPFTILSALETKLMPDLQDLIQEIISFRDERNWKRFHTPRNLSAALALEAGELQETMLWKTDGEIEQLLCTPDRRTSIS
jgi:NDP-sugar pyrophosphorylase family protein